MGLLSKYRLFWKTEAPAKLYWLYPLFSFRRSLSKRVDREINLKMSMDLDGLGQFSSRFFDGNAAQWIQMFEREQLCGRKLNMLEIGSWEGRSAVFLMHYFPVAEITCVDTWKGSDEHVGDESLMSVEGKFDSNVAQFGGRVRKFKGTSLQFFSGIDLAETYDLVYVDGSHHADDVMCDVLNAFRRLKPNGIMICDDYLWDWYPNVRHNPAMAINYLLRQKKGECEILNVTGTQIIVKKLGLDKCSRETGNIV